MEKTQPHEKIFEILFDKDEITWQSILYELVKTNQMDPWDVDITLLTHEYIKMLKNLKELDFRISGKVVLAAAILLRIKSKRLVGEDLMELDRLFAQSEESDEIVDLFDEPVKGREPGTFTLIPRTPQPRKRKVSIYDLMNALEKALEVKRRRVERTIPTLHLDIPERKRDITLIIHDLYLRIKNLFQHKKILTFSNLIPSDSKEDKVYTFIPLLHLSHQRKLDLKQDMPFGEIEILLKTHHEVEQQLEA